MMRRRHVVLSWLVLCQATACGGNQGEDGAGGLVAGSGGANAMAGNAGVSTGAGGASPIGAGGSAAAGASGDTPAGPSAGQDQAGAAGSQAPAGTGGTQAPGGAGGTQAGAAGSSMAGSGAGSGVTGNIMDLSVEPNPNSTLSAYVSWTTAEPSTSLVQFGVAGLQYEVVGDATVTDHRILVIGMRAGTTYDIHAESSGASGSVRADGTFTTGPLPAQIPVASVTRGDAARIQPGWTLMNVQKGNGTERALSSAPTAAVAYDAEGYPVWYSIHGTEPERGGAISVDPTDLGVLIGPADTARPIEVDWAGNEIWSCVDVRCGGTASLSHHAGKLSNGNYIVMRDTQIGARISQVFEELTIDNEMVFSIGVEDAITAPPGASGDWAHGNSITIDFANDVAYLSFRWLGLVKMTYSTKTPLWHLPASRGASGLGDMAFVPANSQFTDIHDPEIHDDGTILFFDNGGWTGQVVEGNPGNLHSRVVEYQIDEAAKTATLTWEWPGSFDTDPFYKQDLYVPFWGDADRLQNGNVLIAAGRRGVTEATPESRVIEVARDDGQVVWELRLPRDHGIYRAERVYPLPVVRAIAP